MFKRISLRNFNVLAPLMAMLAPTRLTAADRLSTALLLGRPNEGISKGRRVFAGSDTSKPRPRRLRPHSLRHTLAFRSIR